MPLIQPTILIVDDSKMVRTIIESKLLGWDCRVFSAEDGERALQIIAEESIDIYLIDINLPGISGIEVLRQLKLEARDQVAMVMTNLEDVDLARCAMELGAFSYLLKPFSDKELKSRLERALEILEYKRAQKDYSIELEIQLRERTYEMSGLMKEISNRKKSQDIILQGMKEGLLAFDKNEKVVILNQAFSKLFNVSEEDCIGKNIEEIFVDSSILKAFKSILKQNDQGLLESSFQQKLSNDLCRTFAVRSSVIFDNDNLPTGKILLISEQTEKLRIEELRKVFLNNVSHEMRTPLTGLISIITALKNTQLNEEQSEYLDIVEETSRILFRQVNSILDFSRLEKGKMELDEKSFDLIGLCKRVVLRFRPLALEKLLMLKLDLEGLRDLHLIGDDIHLDQILSNMVQNAIKFTEKGFVELSAFKLLEREEDIHIEFCVKDSGIGIAKEKHISIFQEFVQGDGTTTRKYGGSGLGLAIVKKLTELMNGSISVESELGQGSLFRCILPFKKVKQQ